MEKINNNELKNISGGVIFNASGITGSDYYNPWEVLDEKGNVVCRCPTRDDAIFEAGRRVKTYQEVTWEQVLQMRR